MKIASKLGKLLPQASELGCMEGLLPLAGRRSFLSGLGKASLGATSALLFGDMLLGQSPAAGTDSANQIFTAALVAEDLATTFYYNGLTSAGVIQDPALAGPGGSATNVTVNGNAPNVAYIRAAMAQEISHANLLRAVGNLAATPGGDPYQTFYFPAGTFDTLTAFIGILEALEQAFIGAYLNAIREFSLLAARATTRGVPTGAYGGPYSGAQLSYFAEVAASILGIECEHRVLGLVITNTTQPNDRYFEQTDTLTSVYHGSASAVSALTPFLTPSTGPGFTLSAALGGAPTVGLSLAAGATLSMPPAE